MNSEPSESELSEEEQSLRQRVADSQRVLEGFEYELRSIDDELDVLAERTRQYDVLSKLCCTLEELDELGAAGLFWNEADGPHVSAKHIEYARRNIDAYSEEIAEVEKRRDAVLGQIGDQNVALDYLHYDLQDAIEREEARRNEWLVERDPDLVPYRAQIMPWARGCEEDARFRKSLRNSLAASLAIALLVSTIAIPIVERSTVNELPERVAKLVRKERTPPPPPEPVEQPLVADEELPEPEPELVEELQPTPAQETVVAEIEQPPAKERVKSKGILAFHDSFASRANLELTPQLGSQARITSAGEDSVGRPERLMVSTSAPGSSGGINLADISRNVGGGGQGMGSVQITRVASNIGGGDGPNRPLSGGMSAGRTDEEIQIVFDRYKAALYRLYNRELRKDPTLRGQLVLRLTIEPDGSVSLCQLHQSDMDAPLLAEQVVDRVSTFDFGAKEDIVAITIIYPIDFLPAA